MTTHVGRRAESAAILFDWGELDDLRELPQWCRTHFVHHADAQ
jgi:hypothetical protein